MRSDTKPPIYLDYNATTPVDSEVLAALRPYLETHFGNPSSGHAYGTPAHDAVERARVQVAALLGCAPDEVVFTAGGSEANNLAIKGTVFASEEFRRGGRPHIITSAVEHPAVANTCRYLAERFGCEVTYLPVDGTGLVDPGDVRRALTPRTALVTVMHANNEVGTIEPIAAIAAVAHEHSVPVHTDAAQSVGKIATRVDERTDDSPQGPVGADLVSARHPVGADLVSARRRGGQTDDSSPQSVDLLTIAGHKLYAPKGVGALYVRRGTRLDPVIHGAGHEGGRRAGTENVAFVVALGTASAIAQRRLVEDGERLRTLRDRLHAALAEQIPELVLNGHPTRRLPNTLNVSFPGWDGEELLGRCSEIAASTGSACHAGRTEPSDVLLALGRDHATALGAVRLSLGRYTTESDVEAAAAALVRAFRAGGER